MALFDDLYNSAVKVAPKINNISEDITPVRKEGVFWKILDFLARPSYAIDNTIKGLIEGKNPLKEAWHGLSGEDKTSAADVLGAIGWNPEGKAGKIARGATGLALDILNPLDPLSKIRILGKGANATKKLIQYDVPFVKKTIDVLPKTLNESIPAKLGQGIENIRQNKNVKPVINWIAEKFGTRPTSMTPEQHTELRGIRMQARGGKKAFEDEAVPMVKDLAQMAKNIPEKDLANMTMKVEESTVKGDPFAQKLHDLSTLMETKNAEMKGKNLEDMKWLTRVLKEEKVTNASKKPFRNSVEFATANAPEMLGREVQKFEPIEKGAGKELFGTSKYLEDKGILTYDKKNNVWIDQKGVQYRNKQATLRELKNAGLDLFESDPLITANKSVQIIGNKIQGKKYVDQLKKSSFVKTEKGPGLVSGEEIAPELKDVFFDKEQIPFLNRAYKAYTNPDELQGLKNGLDTVNKMVKTMITSVNPAFVGRNFLQGGITNWIDNKFNVKTYKQAYEMITNKSGLYKQMLDDGILDTGFFGGSDVYHSPLTVKGVKSKNVIKKGANNYLEKMQDANNAANNLHRATNYLESLREGKTRAEAVANVRKAHFDYEDLTSFERGVMRNVFPFYSWIRNNLPYQLERMVNEPGKLETLIKAKRNIEAQHPLIDESGLTDNYANRALIKLGMNEKNPVYSSLEGFLPQTDLGRVTKPWQTFLDYLSPLIKMPVEMAMNKSFYTEQPLSKFKGDTVPLLPELTKTLSLGKLQPLNVPARLRPALDILRPLNDFEKLVGGRGQENMTPAAKILNYLSGFKTTTYDMDKSLSYKINALKRELSDIKTRMKKSKYESEIKNLQILFEKTKKEIDNLMLRRAA